MVPWCPILFPRLHANLSPGTLIFSCSNVARVKNSPYWTSKDINSLEQTELSNMNTISKVKLFSCSNTGRTREDVYWTLTENSLELIELSSVVIKV